MVGERAERRERGSWFQIVGAAKEKERQPSSDLMKGTSNWLQLEDLRVLVGLFR